MADKLAELAELARGLSINELRLLLRFAEFLVVKHRPLARGSPISTIRNSLRAKISRFPWVVNGFIPLPLL